MKEDENLKVMLDKGAFMPEHAHEEDAGYDLRTPIPLYLPAHGSTKVDTGVHFAIPKNYDGRLESKSGLNWDHDIIGVGEIDCGYTGSVRVKLYNLGDHDYHFKAGDKIIQIVFRSIITPPLELVGKLEKTERGNNGFGSTGK